MNAMIELGWRLPRGGGQRATQGSVLTLVAVVVSTALLLAAVAGNVGFQARAERDAWRHPARAAAAPTALQASSVHEVGDRAVKVVDLARTEAAAGKLPVPPGMSRFPKPGELWASPALADLIERGSNAELSELLSGRTLAGTLGDEALLHGSELLAVVGRTPDQPALTGHPDDPASTPPTPIADFEHGEPSTFSEQYLWLTLFATVLLVVPVLVFGGAAARLTVARRDRRLAALRLVGATPGQVVGLTALESTLTAGLGSVAGGLLYLISIPALARIELGGGTWFLGDLWVGLPWLLGVVLAVPVLVGISAVVGLRQVVVGPLGVARRHRPPALKVIRPVVFVGMIIGFLTVARSLVSQGDAAIIVVVGLLGVAFWMLNLVGPWVVGILGRIVAASARTPARLLAGRRLVDDPRAAWRTVNGIALTGFVAGFVALLNPSAPGMELPPLSRLLIADIRTGTIIVLIASFAVGMVSAGIAAASSVLDRRQAYALLGLAGTPAQVLDAARRRETLIPLAVMGGGSMCTGLLLSLPFLAAMPDLSALVLLGTAVGIGTLAIVGASELSRPLLRSMITAPAPRPD